MIKIPGYEAISPNAAYLETTESTQPHVISLERITIPSPTDLLNALHQRGNVTIDSALTSLPPEFRNEILGPTFAAYLRKTSGLPDNTETDLIVEAGQLSVPQIVAGYKPTSLASLNHFDEAFQGVNRYAIGFPLDLEGDWFTTREPVKRYFHSRGPKPTDDQMTEAVDSLQELILSAIKEPRTLRLTHFRKLPETIIRNLFGGITQYFSEQGYQITFSHVVPNETDGFNPITEQPN